MVKQSLNYTESDACAIRGACIGDVIVLDGQRVKLLKKTNQAVAVEPYTVWDALEAWILAKLGNLLP